MFGELFVIDFRYRRTRDLSQYARFQELFYMFYILYIYYIYNNNYSNIGVNSKKELYGKIIEQANRRTISKQSQNSLKS